MGEEIYVTYVKLIRSEGKELNKISQIIVSQSVVSILIDGGPPPPVASCSNFRNATQDIAISQRPSSLNDQTPCAKQYRLLPPSPLCEV